VAANSDFPIPKPGFSSLLSCSPAVDFAWLRFRFTRKKPIDERPSIASSIMPTAMPAFAPVERGGFGVVEIGTAVVLVCDELAGLVGVVIEEDVINESVDCHRIETPYALRRIPDPEVA